jgi:hypothetical protein
LRRWQTRALELDVQRGSAALTASALRVSLRQAEDRAAEAAQAAAAAAEIRIEEARKELGESFSAALMRTERALGLHLHGETGEVPLPRFCINVTECTMSLLSQAVDVSQRKAVELARELAVVRLSLDRSQRRMRSLLSRNAELLAEVCPAAPFPVCHQLNCLFVTAGRSMPQPSAVCGAAPVRAAPVRAGKQRSCE